jgi:AraC-like DNA-binding protein
MPPCVTKFREIYPAAPDDTVAGLLTMPVARILPMTAGNLHSGAGGPGEYALLSSVQGNFTASAHARYALLNPGQAIVLPADIPYTIQAVSDCLCMLIHLGGELAGRLLGDDMTGTVLSGGAAAVREAVLKLAVLEDERPPVSGTQASSCAYAMLMKLRSLQPGKPSSSLVESATAIIQEEFPFLDGLDELAERLEVSKAHLSRVFTQQTGISPGKYITRVKIEYAKLLLQDEDVSITYVAEASGFANANYFAKVFRRETGMSPSEYLENAPRQKQPNPRLRGTPGLW